jgi:hypothetical protein
MGLSEVCASCFDNTNPKEAFECAGVKEEVWQNCFDVQEAVI